MDKETKQPLDLDSILKEFASQEQEPAAPEMPARKVPEKTERGVPAEKKLMAELRANAAKKTEQKRAAAAAEADAVQRAAQGTVVPVQPAAPKQTAAPVQPAAPKQTAVPVQPAAKAQPAAAPEVEKKSRLPKIEKKEKPPKPPKPPKAPKAPKPVRTVPSALTAVLVVLSLVSLLWIGGNVHPNTGSSGAVSTSKSLNVVDKINVSLNNAASDALGNLTYIKKIFTIEETTLVCPEPNQSNFGSTNDPAVVQAVVEQAAELLDGQSLMWNADLPFWENEPIQYYYDETILVITWKEVHNGAVYSFSEVKIAHGSQLRRALSGNEYGSSVEEYPTDMGAKANAVVGMNGDFYGFRSNGITVYQRELYRHETQSVDTCYFTSSGDMIFSHPGELTTKEEARQFIQDNDVTFSVAFGPVLVKDGVKIEIPKFYPIGEVEKRYSRAVISQKDDLHYILLTTNHEGSYQSGSTLAMVQDVIYERGVRHAYTLDGGQTSTMFLNDELVNRVDWDSERTMTDIIYFATAVPEGGNG